MVQLLQSINEAADIEQFRSLHRRLFRTQQQISKTEALDEDDGRKRKISANWRQKQHQAQTSKLQNDGHWPQSDGAKTLASFNAFNSSTPSEAFNEEPCAAVCNITQHMADVANQVTSMGFHCTSMWQPTAGPYMAW